MSGKLEEENSTNLRVKIRRMTMRASCYQLIADEVSSNQSRKDVETVFRLSS